MKKIDKDFVLSDSSVNCYGFRLLTSGYLLNEFAKNPIGYYMHDRDSGVLVRWENLRVEGDKVLGLPNINLLNSRGPQTVEEINAGFINAASFGHLVILETSDDPALKLPGQTGLTITKWYNRECSLVDVPGNFNAISLYDTGGKVIELKQLSASSGFISKSKLNALEYTTSTPTKVKIDVKPLIAASILAKDITEEMGQELMKQYANDPDKLIELLDEFSKLRINQLMSMDWKEFDRGGYGVELAEKYKTGYKLKSYLEFAKKTNGIIDNSAFLKFAVDNGYIENPGDWNYQETGTNTPAVIFNRIYNQILQSTETLMKSSWDELTAKQLDRLKQEAFDSYKKKYLQKFGVKYQDQ